MSSVPRIRYNVGAPTQKRDRVSGVYMIGGPSIKFASGVSMDLHFISTHTYEDPWRGIVFPVGVDLKNLALAVGYFRSGGRKTLTRSERG